MEKKDLYITVSGQCNTGKSRLTYLLKTFLRENGLDVEYVPTNELPTESTFDKKMSKDIDAAINNIKGKSKITLNEVQLAKPIKNINQILT